MALVAEDGTGRTDAEAYASVAFADAYHDGQGNSAWAELANSQLKEQALRRATAYMQGAYRSRWAGQRISATQALDFPRAYVPMRDAPGARCGVSYYPSDAVPLVVQQACCELALRASAAELSPDLERGILSEEVAGIIIEYDPNSPQQKRFPLIEMLLQPLFAAGGGIRIARG